jgi:FtsP/CotA-like multicopper oxidase with cupredoxin domain
LIFFDVFINVKELIVNGSVQLLRWAMNNISNVHHSTPLIGMAFEASRLLGSWPAEIDDTIVLPSEIPYVWDWTMKVNETGGPNGALGYMGESVILLNDGEVVEIVLQNARALNGAAEFHPWHIHGHSFWVVGNGNGTYNATSDVAQYNLINPILRDTVVLQPLSWVALRFLANNPGVWFFHCHLSKYRSRFVFQNSHFVNSN